MVNEQAVALAEQIPGWMSKTELQWLSDQANPDRNEPINWLEIGTMLGRSWLCVALSLPPGSTIVTVDKGMWEYKHNSTTWRSGHWVWEDREYTLQQTQQLMTRRDINAVFVKAEAIGISSLFEYYYFNTVFIDACHTYEGTKGQIKKYKDKLMPNKRSQLCGHDYCPKSWPGVVQAVDELLPNKTVVPQTTIWQANYGPIANQEVPSRRS